MICESCGRRTTPDLSGLCDPCLASEWSQVKRQANIWNPDALRATVEERPLPKTRRRKREPAEVR